MHMAVDHDGGTVTVQQGTEAFKPAMGGVILISDAADRRVGEQDIKPAGGTELPAQVKDSGLHFRFGIHVDAVRPVTETSAQTQNPDTADQQNFAVGAQTALRRLLFIDVVVISVHIDHGRTGEAGQERQIRGRQIPRRENQVHPFQRFPAPAAPKLLGGLVRYRQNPHCSVLTFCSN